MITNEMCESFFARLKNLSRGEKAALKRAAGTMIADADAKTLSAFYQCLPRGVPRYQEDRWFAVACLRCLWDADSANGEPFEVVFGRMRAAGDITDSTAHRAEGLLDTAWDTDGFMLSKLTRLVKLVRQKTNKAPIDFTTLLMDLLAWNNKSNYVQRNWARAIFTASYTEKNQNTNV